MKILNLYAGIGGNRKLWGDEHEVTSVEYEPEIAATYQKFFPNDTVIVADAHQYLLDHYEEFDFIWSSPPCPTHSKLNLSFQGDNRKHLLKYPDMRLFQEILFLRAFYKGKWVVENVEPFYQPLINPTTMLDRHFFWANFNIPFIKNPRSFDLSKATIEQLAEHFDVDLSLLPDNRKLTRNILRNIADPKLGSHILKASEGAKQEALL